MKIPNLTPAQVADVLGEPLTSDDFEASSNVYGEACEVCDGTGYYPIINKFGEELYRVVCPECGGRAVVSKPKRIQRKRTRGWRMPPNTMSCTRPGKYGNPYYPSSGFSRGFFDANMQPVQYDVRDPRVQVLWFREHMSEMKRDRPERFEEYIAPLRGKDLACWCKLGDPCHVDVLLELARA